jgi:hypothetical protein
LPMLNQTEMMATAMMTTDQRRYPLIRLLPLAWRIRAEF